MGSRLKPPDGNRPIRVTRMKDARHAGRLTRGATWLVNVAVPTLLPDRLTAPLRASARDADDRLGRTARRLDRRQVKRDPTDPDGRTR
jgi:hypothetical protein